MFTYLGKRILFYLKSFVFTYYSGGTDFFWRFYLNLFESVEEKFGFLINIRYFFVPIWQEYSFAGYLVSIPIRTIKIIVGFLIVLLISFLWGMLYLIWCIFPVYLLWKIIRG